MQEVLQSLHHTVLLANHGRGCVPGRDDPERGEGAFRLRVAHALRGGKGKAAAPVKPESR